MNICILMGSMRKNGNTEMLVRPFIEELTVHGAEIRTIWLCDKRIEPCRGCFVCQNIDDEPGCAIQDEMEQIYAAVQAADCIVFATPMYSWFCTPPMKVVMDRFFSLNKFYGSSQTHYSLWENKNCAIIATCGYEIANGVDLFAEAVQRLAKHSGLNYQGMLAGRDIDGLSDFQTKEVIASAKDFARKIYGIY